MLLKSRKDKQIAQYAILCQDIAIKRKNAQYGLETLEVVLVGQRAGLSMCRLCSWPVPSPTILDGDLTFVRGSR